MNFKLKTRNSKLKIAALTLLLLAAPLAAQVREPIKMSEALETQVVKAGDRQQATGERILKCKPAPVSAPPSDVDAWATLVCVEMKGESK